MIAQALQCHRCCTLQVKSRLYPIHSSRVLYWDEQLKGLNAFLCYTFSLIYHFKTIHVHFHVLGRFKHQNSDDVTFYFSNKHIKFPIKIECFCSCFFFFFFLAFYNIIHQSNSIFISVVILRSSISKKSYHKFASS